MQFCFGEHIDDPFVKCRFCLILKLLGRSLEAYTEINIKIFIAELFLKLMS
jgi:hypothetical protein